MTGTPESDLIAHRLEQARKALQEATLLRAAGHLLGTVNRAYYSMFYSIQALLVRGGRRTSKHTGVISLFDREFIRTGLFDRDFSKWLHELFELRQDADYGDMFIVTGEQGQQALDHARMFLAKVEEFLQVSSD